METNNVNSYKPTFSDSFGRGWIAMGDYFLYLFLVVIIMGVIMAPAQMLQIKLNPSDFPINWHNWDWDWEHMGILASLAGFFGALAIGFAAFALAYSLLIVPIFKYGSKMMYVQAVRKIKPDFALLVQGFKDKYFQIVLANLLAMALIMLGFIALILPGIIIACRLVFVPYLVIDKNLEAIEAVEESWRISRGHGWTVFFMALTSFFIFIAGFLLCFIGVFPAAIWVNSSFASLYEAVLNDRNPAPATVTA